MTEEITYITLLSLYNCFKLLFSTGHQIILHPRHELSDVARDDGGVLLGALQGAGDEVADCLAERCRGVATKIHSVGSDGDTILSILLVSQSQELGRHYKTESIS